MTPQDMDKVFRQVLLEMSEGASEKFIASFERLSRVIANASYGEDRRVVLAALMDVAVAALESSSRAQRYDLRG